jgi:predicted alpha/beta-hydrolase family hydrolase
MRRGGVIRRWPSPRGNEKGNAMVDFLAAGPSRAGARYVCAHGAGAGMATPFLAAIAAALAEEGIATLRFEFAYMTARRAGGTRRPPPRAERLIDEYVAVARAAPRDAPLFIGGKSMGGRVASLVADRLWDEGLIAGLICLGYPFHPPNRPGELRTAHLAGLRCPALIIQGERDPFGSRAEVEGYTLSPAIRLAWAADGDHDLGPRGASGHTRRGNLEAAAAAIAAFCRMGPWKPKPGVR